MSEQDGQSPGQEGAEWVGIAANAYSGTGRGRRRVDRLAAELRGRGVEVQLAWTLDERTALVARSHEDRRCRCLVAAGGDGTVAGLVNERPGAPITVLSTGTENLFARHFGMSREPAHVANTILDGQVTTIDVGCVAERRFALMAGIGFDADVVSRHHRNRINGSGIPRPTNRGAYIESVVRSSLGYRFPLLTLETEGPAGVETLTGTTAFVFNLPRYALGLPFVPHALGDDGLLDLLVFQKPGPFRALHYLWLVLRGLHLTSHGVIHRRVRRVSLTTAAPVPVQLDGDPGGWVPDVQEAAGDPWIAEVQPGALPVIVPRSRVHGSG
jgi:diacylglycerol kinase family enzyme